MTNTTTINNIAAVTGKGRPVSPKTKKIRQSIINFLRRCDDVVTTNDVAKAVKQGKQKVVMQLRWLEARGVIAKAGAVKVNKEVAGRPSAMWKVSEEGTPVDMTTRKYKQQQKKFNRVVCEMTPKRRAQLVQATLQVLLERQLEDEVQAQESLYRNHAGFTSYDAKKGTVDAKKGELEQADVAYWLSDRRLFKYMKQLGVTI